MPDTLLVVDDCSDLRDVIKKGIEQESNLRVETASCPVTAMERVRSGAPYVAVLTDLEMPPHPNGLWLCHEIKILRPPLPVVLMTANVDESRWRRMAMQAGADDFLAKPFALRDALELIEKLTKKS